MFTNICPVYLDILTSLSAKQKSSRRRFVRINNHYGTEDNPSVIKFEHLVSLFRVYLMSGFVCWYCGKPMQIGKDVDANGDLVTLDHRIPLIKGGKNTIENLVFCCAECNNLKGDDKHPVYESPEEYAERMVQKIQKKWGCR